MPRASLWVSFLGSVMLLGCLHAPVPWSPDGRWLAYTLTMRPIEEILPPGWLLDANPPLGSTRTRVSLRRPVQGYRLWATRADTLESVLLEDSQGPLTSPGWSPDGTALAYGRLVTEADGRSRYEIVVQDAPGHRRVILSRPLTEAKPEAADLPAAAVAWSPDGPYLAVPILQPHGLAVIRADNGRLLKEIPDAFLPSWSPDGAKLAFYRAGASEGLYCLDTRVAEPRLLLDVDEPSGFPAPAWSRDSQTVTIVHRLATPAGVQTPLVRVRVDNGQVENLKESLFYDRKPLGPDKTLLGASFCIDPNGLDLFSTTTTDGQESLIIWTRLRNGREQNVIKPIIPVDLSVLVGALTASPAGGILSLRVGPPGVLSPPALCEPAPGLNPDKFTPIVPDDTARAEWLAVLVHAAADLLRASLPSGQLDGTAVERPTLLPIPGEFPPDHTLHSRLRRLARLARPLCERPTDAPSVEPAMQGLLNEARLFFAFLSEDYPAALDALELYESAANGPDRSLRLLSLRAQIYLGMKDYDRAEGTIAYLRSLDASPVQRIEETPSGPQLSEIKNPRAAWSAYLAKRAKLLQNPLPANDALPNPPGRRQPGARVPAPPPPRPGAGRLPAPGPPVRARVFRQ
ncbi:MAG: biopolymer transporter Tol [Isosphaeraceae bacterium]